MFIFLYSLVSPFSWFVIRIIIPRRKLSRKFWQVHFLGLIVGFSWLLFLLGLGIGHNTSKSIKNDFKIIKITSLFDGYNVISK